MRKSLIWVAVSLLITGIFLVSFSVLYKNRHEKISFATKDEVTLKGVYYNGGDEAVIICHGFSADWVSAYRLKTAYVSQGYSVLLFDFTGHGSSEGKISFDNARTDRLSKDIAAAVSFMESKGHAAEDIILAGHSMGARSILQYAALGGESAGLVLIGAEVNLDENKQASFFTGAVDSDMPFVRSLSDTNPPAPILLISSARDDILPPASANLLYDKLGGANGLYPRKLAILEDGGLHNYELINRPIIKQCVEWTNEITGTENSALGGVLFTAISWWVAGIAMIMLSPFFMYLGIGGKDDPEYFSVTTRPLAFILSKAGVWIAGLVPAAAILGLFLIIPIGRPLFSAQFVVVLGGYGLLSSVLYAIGRMPYDRLKRKIFGDGIIWDRDSAKAAAVMFAFVLVSVLVRTTGLNKFGTGIDYWIWYILFIITMGLGFLVIGTESNIIILSTKKIELRFLWVIIKYMPFYLFAILYLIIGSTSGLAGALQGLCFLFYAVYSAKIVYKISRNDVLAALTVAMIMAPPASALF